MRLNPFTFMGTKIEEDPQEFVDDIKKIYRVMYASDTEGAEYATC